MRVIKPGVSLHTVILVMRTVALWAYNRYVVVLVVVGALELLVSKSCQCSLSYASITVIIQPIAVYAVNQMLVSIDSENIPHKTPNFYRRRLRYMALTRYKYFW